jgi:spore coat-associated protein N
MSLSISPRTRIVSAAGVVAILAIGASFAAYSDSGSVQTSFTAGSLDLRFDNNQNGRETPYTITFSEGFDTLTPGASVTNDLVVYNSGSIEALGSMAAPTITNSDPDAAVALEDVLNLTITDTSDDTVLYDGALTAAAFSGLDLPADGTTAEGTTLAMEVTMASDATVTVGGQTITVTLPFTATQA